MVYIHGNFLKFVDNIDVEPTKGTDGVEDELHQASHEKFLPITAYDITTNIIMILNTSYSKHRGYQIADVLKSFMGVPTYYPPQEVFQWFQENEHLRRGDKSELFIDGGVFANDAELLALLHD